MYKGIHCYGDFHAHSTYSGHAMSSPSEMVEAAKRKGFNYLALTEHVYQYELKTDIENQNARPRLGNIYLTDPGWPFFMCGGWEFNNFVDNPAIQYQGLRLFGWHSWFGPDPSEVTYDVLVDDYKARAKEMDVLVHPERMAVLFHLGWEQLNFLEFICSFAEENNIAVEFNTSSLRYTSFIRDFKECDRLIIALLKRLKNHPTVPIIIGSDAHVADHIGLNFDTALEMIDSEGLLDRVVNIDEAHCKAFYEKSIQPREKEF